MIKRIVDVGHPARLSYRRKQLVVSRDESDEQEAPLEDIGIIFLDDPQINCTQVLLRECLANNTVVVISAENHIPAGLLLPLDGNSLHAKILRDQIAATEPVKKRLWRALVKAKIRAQADLLKKLNRDPHPLPVYEIGVRSGDPENLEAQASRAYWPKLLGPEFRRDRDATGVNALLNYGYAVLRAVVARAVVGAGLHPSLGLHHHSQYDAFALASDLMEPYRPLVDERVVAILKDGVEPVLGQGEKKSLLSVLTSELLCGDRKLPFVTALHSLAASVARILSGTEREMEIPFTA